MTTAQLYYSYIGVPCRERLAGLIARAKEQDGLAPVTVIVPTPYTALSLRRSLSSGSGLANVRFMVIPRLAEYLGAPVLAAQGKMPLTPLIEAATIRVTSVKMSKKEPLEGLALNPGLHSSLRRTFNELSLLSDEGLEAIAASDPLRSQLVEWYRLFRSRLSSYYNREDLYRAAVEALAGNKTSGALKDLGFIIFHLITDLSPAETEMVKALGHHGNCAMITGLTGEDDVDRPTAGLAERLRPEFVVNGETPCSASPAFPTDHLLIASTAREEVRWIIRRIMQQAQAGLPFHRMAVFYRQQDPYAHLLPVQLGFAGIPVAGPDPSRLKDTPAGKFVLHLMEAIEDDLSRNGVMRWIAESPLKSSDDNPDTPDLIRWETISRQAGITGGKEQWLEHLEHYRSSLQDRIKAFESEDESSPSRARGLHNQEDACTRLISFIKGLIENLPPAAGSSWNLYVKWLKSIISRYLSSPSAWPQSQQESYDKVSGYIDELTILDELMPGGTDLTTFRTMLDDLLQGPAGKTGSTGTGVFIAPVALAQGMEFDRVFIVGMAEGAFPPASPQDSLLPDKVRQQMSGADSLPLQQYRRTGEKRLYMGALAAGTACTLSYPRVDSSSQRPQYPSPWFLDELGKVYGHRIASAEIERLPHNERLTFIYSTRHALTVSDSGCPSDSHEYDIASVSRFYDRHRDISGHFFMREGSPLHRFLAMEQAHRSNSFTAWDGNVSSASGISRRLGLPQDRRFSPTRLERWATCPFRAFMADVLGIAVLEQPEEIMTIAPVDRGALLHRVLERFIIQTQEKGLMPGCGGPWTQPHRDLLLSIAREEFEEAERRGITGRPLLWEMARESMCNDLLSLLQNDSRWRAEENTSPYWVERSFGMDEKNGLPPVELLLKSGETVRLRGMIDRVDINPDGSKIIVIDYKFGSSYPYYDMNKDPLGAGKHLQLPVYALAADEALDHPGNITALYWFASTRGKFERKAVTLADCEKAFFRFVELIASGIGQGLFPANPGTIDGRNENCTYCDFDRICPAGRDLLWERKSSAPELKPYLDLKGINTEDESQK